MEDNFKMVTGLQSWPVELLVDEGRWKIGNLWFLNFFLAVTAKSKKGGQGTAKLRP